MGSTSDRTDALRTSATLVGESGSGKESRLFLCHTMSSTSPCRGPHHHGPMISARQLGDLLIRVLTLSATVSSLSGNAFAQEGPLQVPANATARQYGSGWDCDQGYREHEGTCAVVGIPANAFPTHYPFGPGWECNRGYRAVDDVCVAIEVPENAHLNSAGDNWDCNRPYRRQASDCADAG